MAVQIQESAGERAALAAAIKGTIPSMATAFTSWVLTTYGGFDALATSIVSSFRADFAFDSLHRRVGNNGETNV